MFSVSRGLELDFRRVDALLTEDNCVLEDMSYAVGGGSVAVVVLTESILSVRPASQSCTCQSLMP